MLFSPGPSGRLAAGGRASGGGLAPQQAQPAAAGPGALGALEAPRPRSGAEETRLLRVTKKRGRWMEVSWGVPPVIHLRLGFSIYHNFLRGVP